MVLEQLSLGFGFGQVNAHWPDAGRGFNERLVNAVRCMRADAGPAIRRVRMNVGPVHQFRPGVMNPLARQAEQLAKADRPSGRFG